jgi:uncharacterized protein YndB with AHSA1/START domain
MEKDVEKTWHFKQSPQEVWGYLTKPELIEQWLMKCDFKPEVGHKFHFINKAKIDAYCEVLEIVPFQRLSYSWRKGPSEKEIRLDSVVTWTLASNGGGTELRLQHAGFTQVKDFEDHNEGWDICVGRMAKLLNSSADANA